MVGAGVVPGLELGLRDRGLERDVPQGRGLLEVGLAPGEVAQERALGGDPGLGADRRVVLLPVHRQAEGPPQLLEHLLVLQHELLAQLDEVRPADRQLTLRVRLRGWHEAGVVRQRRVTAHAVVVLHPALGGQAVVVPPHRVEDLLATHPLVARDQVGVGVGEDVAHVQRAGDGGGRRVDGVHLVAGLGAVEGVGVVGLPARRPGGLQPLERRLVRYDDDTARGRRRRGQVLVGRVAAHRRKLYGPTGRGLDRPSAPATGLDSGGCPTPLLPTRCTPMPRPSRRCWSAGPRPDSSRRSTGSGRSPSCWASPRGPIPSCT